MGSIRVFRHYISIPLFVLGIIEFVLLVASVYAGAHIRFYYDPAEINTSIGWLLPRSVAFAAILLASLVALGLFQSRLREGTLGIIFRVASAYVVGAVGLAVLFYLLPSLFIGRGALAIAMAVSFVVITGVHLAFVHFAQDSLKRRVVVLGAGTRAGTLMSLRRRSDQRGFKLVGFVPAPGEEQVIPADRLLHIDGSLADYALAHDIDEYVIALDERRKQLPTADLLSCKMSGVEVTDIQTFFERETGKVRLDLLNPSWLIFSDGYNRHALREISKRVFDIAASLLLLLFTWPIMLIAALAIFVESGFRGPILYSQLRTGQDGKPFRVLKFRSMTVDAEKDGAAQWAAVNDSRVTRVGAILRKFRIDELPQIFNVLKGDMSFVGPRPERPEFVGQLAEKIPYYHERHRVKPGISGWAQLCYPYGSSEKDAREKLQYDLYYVKNHSLFLDLTIMLQTAEVVLFGKGAR